MLPFGQYIRPTGRKHLNGNDGMKLRLVDDDEGGRLD